jgi:tetratricopeptide (TPR) repeat protein
MKHFTLLVLLISVFSVSSFSQKDGNGKVLKKGTDEYKMFMARQDFYGGDYRSALNKYKEVLKNRPNDASVHFYIGECYYMMNTYQDALDELEKAKSIDSKATPELSLVLGKTYHVHGLLDKAIAEFNAYKSTLGGNAKKIEESEVDVFIAQCNTAKQLMTKPVNVKFSQLLDLNSAYEDKGPVLTNGDKTLIFTSRRPAGDKSAVDKEGDMGYFDDIYESYWSDEKKTWLAADLIRGPLNTPEYHDACSSISPDGTMMFLYRSGDGAGEILMSKKTTSGKWKMPENILKPINSSYYEDAAVLSPDGNTLYFISERPGGLGHGDIWTSKKTGEGWSDPVNVGAPLNTPYDENGLYLLPDGKTMFFCSDNTNSMGSYDIFRTTLGADGKWTTPVNLGYPINSVQKESKLVLTADKKTAYISTVRDSGLGERDIWMVDISNYDVLTGTNVPPPVKKSMLAGKITSSDSLHTALSVEIKLTDKSTGTQAAATKSGTDGSYSMEVPGDKQYIIEISAEGYQKLLEEVSLPAGKTESKDIILTKNN